MASSIFNTYKAPGVYADETPTALPTVVSIAPVVVALVGPAGGYKIGSQAIVLTGTASTSLTDLGIIESSIVVSRSNGAVATLTTDYLVTVTGGADTNLTTTTDNVTSITRVGAGQIASGETVIVSYHYTDANYSQPLAVSTYNQVVQAFGPGIDPASGDLVSPLTFAAKIAMDNGARNLVLVAVPDTNGVVTTSDLASGYLNLTSRQDVNIVVGLASGIAGTSLAPGDAASAMDDITNHVGQSVSDGIYRIGIIGFDGAVTTDPSTLASRAKSSRVVLAWPNKLNYFNGYTGAIIEVSGIYLAAAYAGMYANLPVNNALTRKTVSSFVGIPAATQTAMTKAAKDAWSQAGVAVTETSADGSLRVRHGVSTDTSDALHREVSVTRAKDALVRLCLDSIEASGLIGGPLTQETAARVQGIVQGCLEQMKASEFLIDYKGLTTTQQVVDPSVIEVQFTYRPTWPLNYVLVSFAVDTTSGITVGGQQ